MRFLPTYIVKEKFENILYEKKVDLRVCKVDELFECKNYLYLKLR